MTWYRRSLSDHNIHRGRLRRSRVLAVCRVKFSPLRAWRKSGSVLPGELTDPEQGCPECSRLSSSGEPSPVFHVQVSWVERPEHRD